jgi:hypothetical protein
MSLFSADELNFPKEFQNSFHNAQEKSFSDPLSSFPREKIPTASL